MAAIKAYTDIEQSKKLAEILPLESADMVYIMYSNGEKPQNGDANLSTVYESSEHKWYWIDIIDEAWDIRNGEDIPCWSLAALFGILTGNKICHYDNRYYCQYMSEGDEFPIYSTAEYDNPIDACVEMIEKNQNKDGEILFSLLNDLKKLKE